MKTRRIVKYNNGMGALLCNGCRFIIATGFDHEDKAHYCTHCMWERIGAIINREVL